MPADSVPPSISGTTAVVAESGVSRAIGPTAERRNAEETHACPRPHVTSMRSRWMRNGETPPEETSLHLLYFQNAGLFRPLETAASATPGQQPDACGKRAAVDFRDDVTPSGERLRAQRMHCPASLPPADLPSCDQTSHIVSFLILHDYPTGSEEAQPATSTDGRAAQNASRQQAEARRDRAAADLRNRLRLLAKSGLSATRGRRRSAPTPARRPLVTRRLHVRLPSLPSHDHTDHRPVANTYTAMSPLVVACASTASPSARRW